MTDVQITSPEPCVIAIYFVMEGGRLPNATEREELTEYISGENLAPAVRQGGVRGAGGGALQHSVYLLDWRRRPAQRRNHTGKGDGGGAELPKLAAAPWAGDYPTDLIAKIREAGAKRVKLTAPADIVVGRTQLPKCTGQTVTYGGLEDD